MDVHFSCSEAIMNVIPCIMFPGAFSGEIGFEIKFIEGGHIGVASRRYFLKNDGSFLGKELVKEKAPGYIAIRVLEEREKNSILVSIPDGEVGSVNSKEIKRVPEPVSNVPVRS